METENLQETLLTYLSQMVEAAKDGVNWTVDQVPLVVQEYLTWMFTMNVIVACIFLVVACGLGYFARRLYLWGQDECDDAVIVSVIIGVLGVGGCMAGFIYNGLNAVKIKVAPRVVIIEKAADILNGKQK